MEGFDSPIHLGSKQPRTGGTWQSDRKRKESWDKKSNENRAINLVDLLERKKKKKMTE